MKFSQPVSNSSLATFALGLAVGLVGCGTESSSEFQEYDNLGSAESANAPADTTPCSGQAGEVPPTAENSFPVLAWSQPAVVAPVPDENNDSATLALSDNEAIVAVAAPIPATVEGKLPATLIDTSTSADVSPRDVKVLIPERDFKVEGPDKAVRVSYDDIDLLKVLNMDPVTTDAPEFMPEWLSQLNGRRVRIRGFMFPAFEQTGLRAFQLARDNQICCFVRKPKIYDVFLVQMKSGKTTDYIQARPFDVVGTFHIDVQEDEGLLLQLYRIDDAIVIDK